MVVLLNSDGVMNLAVGVVEIEPILGDVGFGGGGEAGFARIVDGSRRKAGIQIGVVGRGEGKVGFGERLGPPIADTNAAVGATDGILNGGVDLEGPAVFSTLGDDPSDFGPFGVFAGFALDERSEDDDSTKLFGGDIERAGHLGKLGGEFVDDCLSGDLLGESVGVRKEAALEFDSLLDEFFGVEVVRYFAFCQFIQN